MPEALSKWQRATEIGNFVEERAEIPSGRDAPLKNEKEAYEKLHNHSISKMAHRYFTIKKTKQNRGNTGLGLF